MKIDLILLAAGNSTRFEGNKLLTILDNKPMYMHIVDKVIKVNFNKIILVTQYEEIRKNLLNYNIKVIVNNNSELGISHSIKLGLENSQNADAYMFMVCDQPYMSTESIEKLMSKFKKSNKGLGCIKYDNILWNPAVFSKKYKTALMDLNGDKGGKAIINKNLNDLITIEIYKALEIMDIDTRKEFEEMKNK